MADISAQIRAIQQTSRGEEVRDSIVTALQAINTNIETDVVAAVNRLLPTMLSQAVSTEVNSRMSGIITQATNGATTNTQTYINQILPFVVQSEVTSQVNAAKPGIESDLTTVLTAEITRQINAKLEDGSEVEF